MLVNKDGSKTSLTIEIKCFPLCQKTDVTFVCSEVQRFRGHFGSSEVHLSERGEEPP